ncbi:hypothetical protein XELAEV_18027779mg [Xenopus laevis]|uniref:Uncharacterized protein n=1 Tax=Xenopus laevis TaxID=8355 RepID=A0A974CYR3_XENLA|nr:hypothetical protein XELAEV_18027779mg [Xenopus laevis]
MQICKYRVLNDLPSCCLEATSFLVTHLHTAVNACHKILPCILYPAVLSCE